METAIKDAIKALASKSKEAGESLYAMQYAQAALNLAHILATQEGIEQTRANIKKNLK